MSNYLASYFDREKTVICVDERDLRVILTEKKTVMICDDERDLLELFGKAIKSKHNAHNSTLTLSKF
jgi:hypothetical protein